MKTLISGSLGYDFIMSYDGKFTDRILPNKLDTLSLSFLVKSLDHRYGGTAGNIAYALKKLGVEPEILGCIGGIDGTNYLKYFKKNKISTKYIRTINHEKSSAYFVITDQSQNQIGSYFMGAMKFAKNLSVLKTNPTPSFVVIMPTDPQAMIKHTQQCQQAGISYLFDPAFQIATFSLKELEKAIKGAKILIGNDYEIALIKNRLQISHETLKSMVSILITTLGQKGSTVETIKEAIHIKSVKVENVVDPTGAGDAYRGGFVSGFLRGYDLTTCGQMGSLAAAYSIETSGTQNYFFTLKEFQDRFKKNFQKTLKL